VQLPQISGLNNYDTLDHSNALAGDYNNSLGNKQGGGEGGTIKSSTTATGNEIWSQRDINNN